MKKVAIACQGGGSHTAFTAGVLNGILTAKTHGAPLDIVAISGTSGSAICGLLAWHGLIRGDTRQACDDLKAFWSEPWPRGNAVARVPMTPVELFDVWQNACRAWFNRSHLPDAVPVTYSPSYNPYSVDVLTRSVMPPLGDFVEEVSDVRRYLKELIEEYVDDRAIRDAVNRYEQGPKLLVGAVDVCTGEPQLFRSDDPSFGVDAVVASAALPTLMKAVCMVYDSSEGPRRGTYWDGLFSQNPPLRELPKLLNSEMNSEDTDNGAPDTDVEREIWLVRINPKTRDAEPREREDILDRRNELSGNLSLEQELYFIKKINELIEEGRDLNAVKPGFKKQKEYRQIKLREIELPSKELERQNLVLDVASKADRRADLLATLFAEGERLSAELTNPSPSASDNNTG